MDERPETVAAFVQDAMGEVELCPNCFNPVFPGLTFCHTCMAPVSVYAAWGPYERIWSTAWILWKATWSVGVRPWHGAVAWIAFVWLAVIQVAFLFVPGDVHYLSGRPDPLTPFLVILSFAFTSLQLVFAWRIIRNVRRVTANQHPDQTAGDDDEWAFGAWDDDRGLPVGHDALV